MSNNNNNDEAIPESRPTLRHVAMRTERPMVQPALVQPVKAAPVPIAAAPRVWQVEPLLEPPFYYQMERCHVHIQETPPLVIAERILQCVRDESIAGDCLAPEPDEPARFNGETETGVVFQLRLWRAENAQVVVEYQRVSGCSYASCMTAGKLLRAAKGEAPRAPSPPLALPKDLPPTPAAEARQHAQAAIGFCERLLAQESKLDARALAMESLVQLSESPALAQTVLKSDCVPVLAVLIAEEHDASVDAVEAEHLHAMRRGALAVLANCYSNLAPTELEACLQARSMLVSDSVLRALNHQVATCREAPHEASAAARCLASLAGCARLRPRLLIQRSVVEAAREEGAHRHAHLGDSASRLSAVLGYR